MVGGTPYWGRGVALCACGGKCLALASCAQVDTDRLCCCSQTNGTTMALMSVHGSSMAGRSGRMVLVEGMVMCRVVGGFPVDWQLMISLLLTKRNSTV